MDPKHSVDGCRPDTDSIWTHANVNAYIQTHPDILIYLFILLLNIIYTN